MKCGGAARAAVFLLREPLRANARRLLLDASSEWV
jgi:hypothetical protein